MALIDDFKTRFPEFDTATVDQVLPRLDGVWQCYFAKPYIDDCDKEIILNLCAHLLVDETSEGSGSLKSTQSQSVDGVSVSYSGSGDYGQDWSYFGTTKYGKRFVMLTKKRRGAVFV